jgi:hypothetical protein
MEAENFLFQPQKVYEKCPSCKTGYLDTRIKRSFLYKHVLFFVKVKRYKCSACNCKRHLPVKEMQKHDMQPAT